MAGGRLDLTSISMLRVPLDENEVTRINSENAHLRDTVCADADVEILRCAQDDRLSRLRQSTPS